MNKTWKISMLVIFLFIILGMILGGAYIKNVGFHNVKLMYTLQTTDTKIVEMNEVGDYLAIENQSIEPLMKERMSSEGWNYVEQEGSNYFFEKGNEKTIVTVKQWNHNYVIYRVKGNVTNLAD